MLQLFANTLWYLSYLPEWQTFKSSLSNTEKTQRQLLFHLLQRHAHTFFGRQHHFQTLRSIAEYQASVPFSTQEDYYCTPEEASDNTRLIQTANTHPLTSLHSTHIPEPILYASTLKTEYHHALAPWTVDLFTHNLSLFKGQIYWSIPPLAHHNAYSIAGFPTEFEQDPEALSNLHYHLLNRLLAAPIQLRLITDLETYRYLTLLFLLRSPQLSLISIWNPSFLTALLARLPAWYLRLATDINNGTLTPPRPLPSDLHAQLSALNLPNHRRALEITTICENYQQPATIYNFLWPNLQLIACWTDAQIKKSSNDLRLLFPKARIQNKGLCSTEGFISFPLTKRAGSILAIRSHFFEFLPTTGGKIRLAHELDVDQHYEIVLTTGGGLYRYQTQSIVHIIGYQATCPLLHFVKKTEWISDWFGEKLQHSFVEKTLKHLLFQYKLSPKLALLSCENLADNHYAYVFFIEVATFIPQHTLFNLTWELEKNLQQNPHYTYSRTYEQLDSLRLFRIEREGLETYTKVCNTYDLKTTVLTSKNGWLHLFQGHLFEVEKELGLVSSP